MRVLLHAIERCDDGQMGPVVSIGNDPPKRFTASFDGSQDDFKYGGCDEELFFALSNAAYKRYGTCAVYQMELMAILGAFDRGERLPEMPIELGTSPYGREFRPTFLRTLQNKLWILLFKMGIIRPGVRVHSTCQDNK